MKNCGGAVHAQVVEKGVLADVAKIARKGGASPAATARARGLIQEWADVFPPGPTCRHTEYFLAFDELKRSGVPFPPNRHTASSHHSPSIPVPTPERAAASHGVPPGGLPPHLHPHANHSTPPQLYNSPTYGSPVGGGYSPGNPAAAAYNGAAYNGAAYNGAGYDGARSPLGGPRSLPPQPQPPPLHYQQPQAQAQQQQSGSGSQNGTSAKPMSSSPLRITSRTDITMGLNSIEVLSDLLSAAPIQGQPFLCADLLTHSVYAWCPFPPTLSSLADITTGLNSVEVLSDLLSAAPKDNPGSVLGDELVQQLVGECRGLEGRLAATINSTSTPALLRLGSQRRGASGHEAVMKCHFITMPLHSYYPLPTVHPFAFPLSCSPGDEHLLRFAVVLDDEVQAVMKRRHPGHSHLSSHNHPPCPIPCFPSDEHLLRSALALNDEVQAVMKRHSQLQKSSPAAASAGGGGASAPGSAAAAGAAAAAGGVQWAQYDGEGDTDSEPTIQLDRRGFSPNLAPSLLPPPPPTCSAPSSFPIRPSASPTPSYSFPHALILVPPCPSAFIAPPTFSPFSPRFSRPASAPPPPPYSAPSAFSIRPSASPTFSPSAPPASPLLPLPPDWKRSSTPHAPSAPTAPASSAGSSASGAGGSVGADTGSAGESAASGAAAGGEGGAAGGAAAGAGAAPPYSLPPYGSAPDLPAMTAHMSHLNLAQPSPNAHPHTHSEPASRDVSPFPAQAWGTGHSSTAPSSAPSPYNPQSTHLPSPQTYPSPYTHTTLQSQPPSTSSTPAAALGSGFGSAPGSAPPRLSNSLPSHSPTDPFGGSGSGAAGLVIPSWSDVPNPL
ncbi:unnamed protein product [Closterium sp. NIES-65]|nr:unnamed protein product [Closterium sp. NIES-65]